MARLAAADGARALRGQAALVAQENRPAAEGGLGPPGGSRTPESMPSQRRGLAGEPGDPPRILATGGFQGDAALVAEHIRPAAPLARRANPWSSGDGLRYGLERGAALS